MSSSQLLKSVDGGLNWGTTSFNNTVFSGAMYDIAVSPTDSNVVLARVGSTLKRSIDGGVSWSNILTGLPNAVTGGARNSETLDWDLNTKTDVYFITTSNNNKYTIYKSTDGGISFNILADVTLPLTANSQVIAWCKLFLPTNNTTSFYVAVGTGTDTYAHRAVHLYKFNKNTGAEELSRINMLSGIGDPYKHGPILHHGDMMMDRTNENKIVFGSYGNEKLQYSIDNGQTFNLSNTPTHPDIRAVDFVNGQVVVGSDGEVVYSADSGVTCKTISNSISNHELWGFGSAHKSNLVASGNNHGPVMIKETYNGFDWYNGSGADQGNTDVNPLDDRYIYSNGYSNYRYFRTGPHALQNEVNLLDNGGFYSYFNQMEFHPNKYYTLITHHAGQFPSGNANLSTWKNSLIKTEDNGQSIAVVKTFNKQVFREKISMRNPNVMLVVEGISANSLWKTNDGGVTWVNITPSTSVTIGSKNISDIAIGDVNPQEIWVTYSGVQSVCKVLKSNDGGSTWTNLTTPVLTTSPITKLIYQRGTNGGVYVGNKAGVYYRNNTMTNWEMLGKGLPMCDIRFMHINYNEGKLKIGTSRGAFTNDLYEKSLTLAQISVNTNKVTCGVGEPLRFKDYSVVKNASATWQWSFSGGVPSTSTEENPVISYANAPNGFYDVTLTVTDANGTSTQTLPNFIEVTNICGTSVPDKIPGNSVLLTGAASTDYVKINDYIFNKNSFTFSCWIKPKGIQANYSAVFMSQNDLNPFGLNFLGSNNTLGFHPAWTWSSGLIAPADKWSHVALVSNGTNVKIYVNGKESVNSTAMTNEIFAQLDLGRYGRGRGDRYTNLEMDEVAVWNRALTIDEIRKWRHLTKSIAGDPILNGLVYYFQFNETAGNITVSKNNTSRFATYAGTGYSRPISNVPVFEGVSEKIAVNSSGVKDFTTTGLALEFSSGTYPNGDVWVSRGSINPDQLPTANTNYGYYTIVNNYGTNATFSPLTAMSFYGTAAFEQNTTPADYKLYKRGSNDFGATWGSFIDTADSVTGTGLNTKVIFNSGLNVTGFSQFVLTNEVALGTDQLGSKTLRYSIFPNPIHIGESLHINLKSEVHSEVSLFVYDSNGKKVAETTLEKSENQLLLNLPQGIYLGVLSENGNKQTLKIVIK